MRTEIRISGFGGQGVGLAGYILGKALALYDGKEAVMTQSYGPEARGGASNANVVVSNREIAYPFVQNPDILVVLSQEAYVKFRPSVKPAGLIFLDVDLVSPDEGSAYLGIPAVQIAEELGRRIVTNMVMLGFLAAVSGVVSREALEQAIESTVKPKTLALNRQAFAAGYTYAKQKEPRP